MNTKLEIILFILSGVSIFLFFLCAMWIMKTEKRLKKLFLGKKAKDLEDIIVSLQDEIEKLSGAKDDTAKEIDLINLKLKKSIRGLEVVRFNPFPDQGGNQSFALSLLNEDGDGMVLSSLYSRERMSIFAKPIHNGASEYELSGEEKEALTKAKV